MMIVDDGLSFWGAWESCNVTCGGGLQRRVLKLCLNGLFLIETFLVDGGWNEWSPWSICTKTVSGIQIRFRECSNPEPAYGGKHCNGSRVLVRECNKMSGCHEGNIQMVKSVCLSFNYMG